MTQPWLGFTIISLWNRISESYMVSNGVVYLTGIATRYWPDCPGIESRWWARFSAPVHTDTGGPPSFLYNGYRVPFPGVKRPGRRVDHLPHLGPRLRKSTTLPFTLSLIRRYSMFYKHRTFV